MRPAEHKSSYADIFWRLFFVFSLALTLLWAVHALRNHLPRYLLLNEFFRLRAEPDTSSVVEEEGKRGSLYKIIGLTKGEATVYGSLWLKVLTKDGREAYIALSGQGQQQLLTEQEVWRWRYFQLGIPAFAEEEAEDELFLTAFPPSYRPGLKTLHLLYPDWIFEPVPVKEPWPEVLAAELEPEDRNLVQYRDEPYFAPYAGMVKHRDKVYDGASWYAANEQAVAYFLDPRNFFNTRDIFQFLELHYGERVRSDTGVRSVFKGNEALEELTPLVMEAARTANIRPEALASRMRQEISHDGGISLPARGLIDPLQGPLEEGSPSPGFLPAEEQLAQLERLAAAEGEKNLSPELQAALARARQGERAFAEPAERYYNFFNIGAYPDPQVINGAALNAAKYAAGLFFKEDSRRKEELRLPWNSRERAMTGGALFIAADYIGRGQDTAYLQKFDLVSGTFSHQYMQAVFAAQNDGQRLFKVWSEAAVPEKNLTFRIPVFQDMPAKTEYPAETQEGA